MPSRAVESRLVAGMNVAPWPSAPTLSARNEFKLDDALRAQRHRHCAIEILLRRRHEDSHARPQRSHYFRPAHDLRKMRRPNLFLALGHQHKVHGHLTT